MTAEEARPVVPEILPDVRAFVASNNQTPVSVTRRPR